MRKYEDVKMYLDNNSHKCADEFNSSSEYLLYLKIGQMYRELEQVKLSYERLLEKDFKGTLIRKVYQARQNLYNARSRNPRKQDLIDGINYAINNLNEILDLEKDKKGGLNANN